MIRVWVCLFAMCLVHLQGGYTYSPTDEAPAICPYGEAQYDVTPTEVAVQVVFQATQNALILLRSAGIDLLSMSQGEQLDAYIYRLQSIISQLHTSGDPTLFFADEDLPAIIAYANETLSTVHTTTLVVLQTYTTKFYTISNPVEKQKLKKQIILYQSLLNGLNLSQVAVNTAQQAYTIAIGIIDGTTLEQLQVLLQLQANLNTSALLSFQNFSFQLFNMN